MRSLTHRPRLAFVLAAATSITLACSPQPKDLACLDGEGRPTSCDTPGATFVPTDLTCVDANGTTQPLELCQQQIDEAGTERKGSRMGMAPLFFFWAASGARSPATAGYPRVPYHPSHQAVVPSSYGPRNAPVASTTRAPAPARTGLGSTGRSFGSST